MNYEDICWVKIFFPRDVSNNFKIPCDGNLMDMKLFSNLMISYYASLTAPTVGINKYHNLTILSKDANQDNTFLRGDEKY